ncbi:rhamnan synthesis F family protein [Pseudomonas tohonis]|uniref:rhamnan synthesis F family protein n=1 Tax=Pseudomonas tohonis TaxID=2725477 RepID=UPI0021DB0917|nr:rhamnan synthesis F family protein [Pseudomonas tohonis]UXY52700.1 hypothetical protein N9L84_27755 [Pseudomonas tohonis]
MLKRIRTEATYGAAYIYLWLQSLKNGVSNFGSRERVIFMAPYQGQKLMLLALYEKGRLRDDVIRLLEAAKQLGIYTLCINTLKLDSPNDHQHLIDCYIERHNFGRDFGSYKTGFEFLYASAMADSCPRLLMVNDSIYFSAKHCKSFLQEMFESTCDVLGATENHEIEHHLGSFCIAMSGEVLRSKGIRAFWRRYRCSDVRPVVIRRGEMALSRHLRKAARSAEHFRALYDTTRAAHALRDDEGLLEKVVELTRNSKLVPWRTFSLGEAAVRITSRYLHNSTQLVSNTPATTRLTDIRSVDVFFSGTVTQFVEALCNSLSNESKDRARIQQEMRAELLASFLDCFSVGSQIHQNNAFLHAMGLPLIKMDGLYRGMFNPRDIENLANSLDLTQREHFRRTMYGRPFGGQTLSGWRLTAFYRGLL